MKCDRKPEIQLNPADELFMKDTWVKCKNHLKMQLCQYKCLALYNHKMMTCFVLTSQELDLEK